MAICTEQEFNRQSIAAVDFARAIEFAVAAQQHPENSTEYEGVLFAAIVSYVRPFSQNERSDGTSAASRLPLTFINVLSEAELELHQKCVNFRNKALAHSEHSLNPTRLRPGGVVVSRPFSLLTLPFDLPSLIRIAEKLKLACERDRASYVLGNRRITDLKHRQVV